MRIGYLSDRYCKFINKLNSNYLTTLRPCVGPLLHRPSGIVYYAPLGTSHHNRKNWSTPPHKSVKLWDAPKAENEGFIPIRGCEFGGVYIDRLTPVPPNKPLFTPWEEVLAELPNCKGKSQKRYILTQQEAWAEENTERLLEKAKEFWKLMDGRYTVKYLAKKGICTPDLKKLEKACWDFNPNKMARKNAIQTGKVFFGHRAISVSDVDTDAIMV